MNRIVKLSLLVNVGVEVLEDGSNVWRAICPSAGMHADAQTPEAAVDRLKGLFLSAENEKIREAKVVKFEKETEQAPEALPEVKEEEEVSEEVPEAEVLEEDVDLSELKLKELRELAEERGVEHEGLRKAELVAALSDPS